MTEVDAYRRVRLDGSDLVVELDSGRRVPVPVDGVLRLRSGDPAVCDDTLLPDLTGPRFCVGTTR